MAERSPSPFPRPPLAGSKVGLAAVVILEQYCITATQDSIAGMARLLLSLELERVGWGCNRSRDSTAVFVNCGLAHKV